MADITMCNNQKCEMSYKCYRYRAIPNKHGQSYFLMDRIVTMKSGCAYWWEYDYDKGEPVKKENYGE